MADIVGIGNALVDILVKVEDSFIDKWSLRKGTMHLVDEEQQKRLSADLPGEHITEIGGSALNTIRALALLDESVAFYGSISDDELGKRISDRFLEIGLSNELMISEGHTGSCVVLVTPDGERTMNTCLGSSCSYTLDNLPMEKIKAAKFLHFTGYQWSTDQQKDAIYHASEEAKRNGVTISFDVADPFMVEQHRDSFKEFIATHADLVFANSDEAKALFGDPMEAGRTLAAEGVEAVIKMSEKGATIFKGSSEVHCPTEAAEVVDTTGAGDMYAGGYLYGRVNGRDVDVCGKMGNILAGDVISRIGAQLSNEALKRVRSL